MDQHIIDTVRALRLELHDLAELSGAERRTKARLMAFLRENTSLRLADEGQWFCAIHREEGCCGSVTGETIALRADMDALPFGDSAAHLCGHDGHSAALAGLGLLLENKKVGRNVILVFQHAEETGEGGKICAKALEKYGPDRIYALHNIPGQQAGTILLRRGVFACASRGMTVKLTGAAAHAAYPEFGRNPGFAAARLISALPELTRPDRYKGLTMATLIGTDIGSKAFGAAAATAELRLTLRAWHDDDLAALISAIQDAARTAAAGDGLDVSFSFCDIFPACVNNDDAVDRLARTCRQAGLTCANVPEPFRWSEDFAWYGRTASAAMAGLGAGEDWPPLHTAGYTFNDDILPPAMMLLAALAEFG